jgi:cytidylate kinase
VVHEPGREKLIVALDGPAGVGKSTISKRCASEAGFLYLNSGNIYRAVTRIHLDLRRDPESESELIKTATDAVIGLSDSRVIANGVDVTDTLHSDDVDSWVAQHSSVIPVRHIVINIIRDATRNLDVVVEGRDITTVVFPDANLKIYLDASIEVRAQRRFLQGTSTKTLDELRANIAMRDKIDSNKQEGSLKIALDASYIDTSCLTIEQVCEKVSALIRSTLSNRFA